MENFQQTPQINDIAFMGDVFESDAPSTVPTGFGYRMGTGACTAYGCTCKAYFSDMQHDGHCTCGHTAADHS